MVVETLSEEEAYLLAIITDESGLDLAEFTWFEGDTEDNCFRAWDFQWAWWHCTDPQQIDQCFPAGTLILTERGQVPIEAVQVGDRVFTHGGRWRPVLHLWDRGEQDTVVIKGHGHPGLITTADHEFLREDGTWGSPRVADRWGSPCRFPSSTVPPLPERTYAPGRPSNIPHDVSSPELLWLYGLYLAEGSCSSSFGRGGTVNRTAFSVHTAEISDVESMLDKVGLRYNTQPVKGEACSNIVVNSRPLAAWLTEHGGTGARNKHLASWVLGLDDERRRAVIDGAFFGDGYLERSEYTTVSKSLAVGIKLLGQSLGYTATFRRAAGRMSVIGGRIITGGEQYVVGLASQRNDHHDRVVTDGQRTWAPVKQRSVGVRVRCFDLEVADDHSYVAESLVVHNCARSVGKSLSVRVRGFAFPFIHPGAEMVVTAPELVHLEPIVNLIENQFFVTRLGREMLQRGRSAITHRPFMMNFANSARIIGRIPQRDGKGVKGIHPIWLELDEAQDYPRAGWIELSETLKRGFDGAVWRAHGVTRGMRDKFFEYSQPGSGWTVHNFAAMSRPNFTDDERSAAIKRYGGREDPDYRRNMLGAHGDVANRLFVLSRLMRCVDVDESSDYNTEDYYRFDVKDTEVEANGLPIEELLDFPSRHHRYETIWCGMDVGFTSDPSEILVFAEYHPSAAEMKADKAIGRASPENGLSRVKCIARVSLRRISHPDQVSVILRTIDFYQPKAFAMDKTGNGLPLFQAVQGQMQAEALKQASSMEEARQLAEVIKGYNFSEKVIVDLDQSIEVDMSDHEKAVAEAGMKRNVLEYSTDCLRDFVDNGRLLLPIADKEMLAEFSGQTFAFSKEPMDGYGRKRRIFSEGRFHALDAARMAIMALAQAPIETFIHKKPVQAPVYDSFMVM